MARAVSLIRRYRPLAIGAVVFVLAVIAAAALTLHSERRQMALHRAKAAAQALDKAHEIRGRIEHALAATYALAALVREGHGEIRDLDAVARAILPSFPGAAALQLAPGGVIRQVAPLAGNERAIGIDLLAHSMHSAEAFLARDTGNLTLAGPFELAQGGTGAVGRLPVYLEGPDGDRLFWGFAAVLLRFSAILDAAQLDRLDDHGLRYELWRIRPDTGARQVIAASSGAPLRDPVREDLSVPNGTWTLGVEPVAGWHDNASLALNATLGAAFSLLLGWLAMQMAQLRAHGGDLQRRVAQRSAQVLAREADLNRAQAVAHLGSWMIDLASSEARWSAEAYRIAGIERSRRVTTADFVERVHPDDRARFDAAWRDALRGRPYDIEHRLIVDGAVRWVRQRAEFEFDAAGRALRCVGTIQDITAARAVDQQLRKLSTAVEHSPASIVITDRDGTIEYVNPQFEHVTGYTLQEVVGKNPRILKSGTRSPEEYAALWDTLTTGGVWRGEFENVRKDGSLFFEMASIAPIRAADGAISGFVAVKEDTTLQKRSERALAESEARYRAMFADSKVVMLVLDPDSGAIVQANRTACEYYGYDADAMTRMHLGDIDMMSRDKIARALKRSLAGDADIKPFRHRRASGEVRDVEVAASPIEIGGRKLIYSIIQDVTERKRYEARMHRAMVVFRASSQGIMTTDAQGVITSVNPAFCAITGYAGDDVIGRNASMFRSERHDEAFFEAMWNRLVDNGAWEGEIWTRRKNGETYPQWLSIAAVCEPGGAVSEYVSMFSDITERKQQEAAMWRQANFDPLTGLANRSLLQDRLERALAQARRHGRKVGVMFLDLDGFKWINDSLGHHVGDELLADVARRLSGSVREQDTVARLGGDEFTVVVHDVVDSSDLDAVADKLVTALHAPFALQGARHHISASIGITVFPDDGDDVQALLRNADVAMYKAKHVGKNRACFYAPQMQADALARLQLEADLRVALEQRAFELHYQPIVEAAGGALIGAEALIRWWHPQRGMVPPAEFIPVAEDCGLILPIGEWVLREAARQWQQWRALGLSPQHLAVNMSGVQFREAGLPELLAKLLAEFGIERDCLTLEITESVLMEGSDAAEARMREIKGHGVSYALDDFGTGFSSLSYLKRFPVDVVKIDRSFVRDCPHDKSDASLVEAIINMVHGLDLRVIAEGVETEEQMAFLRALGCDYVQGYLIGKPMPAGVFETMMARPGVVGGADLPPTL